MVAWMWKRTIENRIYFGNSFGNISLNNFWKDYFKINIMGIDMGVGEGYRLRIVSTDALWYLW
jgi:hypothetical protein